MRYRPLSFPVWPLPDYLFPSSAAPFHCPGLSALRQIPTPSPLPVLPPQPRCSFLTFCLLSTKIFNLITASACLAIAKFYINPTSVLKCHVRKSLYRRRHCPQETHVTQSHIGIQRYRSLLEKPFAHHVRKFRNHVLKFLIQQDSFTLQ